MRIFALTVPGWHTVRSALGSFFYTRMPKPALTINQQIELLEERGMEFNDLDEARHFLSNISYYRLAGYWWEMQEDRVEHLFFEGTSFSSVVQLYNFDRHFKLIVFDAIERLEIALRTKLIYHLSLKSGGLWYQNASLFSNQDYHEEQLEKIQEEIDKSKEEFLVKHKENHPDESPEAWKALEVITLNTLSKQYENLNDQLPEKSKVANEFGLYFHNDFSSWLRTTTYIRNLVAHHSRLWNRYIIIKYSWPKSTSTPILNYTPDNRQTRKIFPILSGILHMLNHVSPGHAVKEKLLELFRNNPEIPLSKMGFPAGWENQPIWRD